MVLSRRVLVLGGAVTATVVAAVVVVVLLLTQPASPGQVPVTFLGVSPSAGPGAAAAGSASSSTVSVPAFGANQSGLSMDLYVPPRPRPSPAILVALHECQSTGQQFFEGTDFGALADKYGFLVIYQTTPSQDGCWDVSSTAALRRGGGSDPVSIMSMVTYTERRYHASPHQVYVTGASSGAIMTGVLLADYPDVFAAGAIFMGLPVDCSGRCSFDPVTLTPQRWGGLVRKSYPGYHGPRPRVQIWHGTDDDVLPYANLGEQISQWTNVLGISQAPVITDHPVSGWTRTAYGTSQGDITVEGYSIRGASHDLPEPLSGMEWYAIHFFGLDR
jgi:poly(hydroxyalkanoate) depolymerase family esterase